jgi:hypothetical protein
LATFACLGAVPAIAIGSDDGPRYAVATIRHDLPILLADALKGQKVQQTPVIQWVVTDGRKAVAHWRA